jgi:NtrC-family two-component system sensor histidine kinase KinB
LRVFEKFFRLEHHHAETRPGARGAGIGLYMCRQIVELHGGAIACTAGDDGRGTRITVTLPASERGTADSLTGPAEAGHYAGRAT